MSGSLFQFGEQLPGYPVPVLNERAVRAAAGIVFFFAIVSFMNAWLIGNFQPTRVFVVAFLIDFTLRIFVNPKFAPSLILGQWMVRKQQPEWVGAPQKRFAWAIGFVLAAVMLYLVVIRHVIGPINLIVCAACLVLLFFETAFGICLGCKVYNWFHTDQAQFCPGGVCEFVPARGAGGTWSQGAVVLAPLDASDVPRMRELMRKYRDRPMDLADAALVRVAEREKIRTIFTVDRSDFETYRPSRTWRFSILPR